MIVAAERGVMRAYALIAWAHSMPVRFQFLACEDWHTRDGHWYCHRPSTIKGETLSRLYWICYPRQGKPITKPLIQFVLPGDRLPPRDNLESL